MMWNISTCGSRFCLAIYMFALCALPLHSQTANTGAIAGTVSDPNGALVPRASVVINNQGTGEKRDLATYAQGSFWAPFLKPGNYYLIIHATVQLQHFTMNHGPNERTH